MILTGFLFGLGFIIAIVFFYFIINNLELVLPSVLVIIAFAVIVACVVLGIAYWEQALTIILYIGALALIGYIMDRIFNRGKEISEINKNVEQEIEEFRKKRTKSPVSLWGLALKKKYILVTVFLISAIGSPLLVSLSDSRFETLSVSTLIAFPVTLVTLIILLVLY